MKKTNIIFIIALLVVGGASFYGGMKYQQSKSSNSRFIDFQNLTSEQRQQRMQNMNPGGIRPMGNRQGGANGNNFINGEILSKDDKSITVKLPDGGSKIVFFSSNTQIGKSAIGTSTDLVTGEQIMANGNNNSDGSITATSIQIRQKN